MRSALFAGAILGSLFVTARASADPPLGRLPSGPAAQALVASLQHEADARAAYRRDRLRPLGPAAGRVATELAKDPRTQVLARELAAARGRGDSAFEAAVSTLAPQILALRKDVTRGARLSQADAQALGIALPPPGALHNVVPPAQPGSILGSAVLTTFPDPQGFKSQCTNDSDTWHFGDPGTHAESETDVSNTDCMELWAGRGAVIEVPANATRMTVSFTGTVDLNVWAVAWGFYAHAWAGFSLALTSTDGGTTWPVDIAGYVTQVPVTRAELGHADARSYFVSPLPADHGHWKKSIADGDPDSTVSFDLPPGRTSNTFEIRPIVQVQTDSVATGEATASADVTTTSVRVTFYR